MVQLLWRNDSTIYQNVHTQARFLVLARISHMDDRVTHGKFEILAYVRVQAHDMHIFDCLNFPHFIVEPHGVRPPTVQGIVGTQQTLSHYSMCEQFGFLSIVKFTFPLNLDLTAPSRYLL